MPFCASCNLVIAGPTKYLKRTNKGIICTNCQLQNRINSILSGIEDEDSLYEIEQEP